MKPFLLDPVIKDYLWGGRRLIDEYGKTTDLACAAESWELSAHPHGQSKAASGELNGLTLSEVVQRYPDIVRGGFRPEDDFPVLVKLIDAKQQLSLQVHPDDEYAKRVEHGVGKTEMWIIIDAEPGAFLYLGPQRTLSKDELRDAVAKGTLESLMHRQPVKAGEAYLIRAGTLHAAGAGVLFAEVQQCSDLTYRVYDFNRLGPDLKPRELHVEKALEVAALEPADCSVSFKKNGADAFESFGCEYFSVERITADGELELEVKDGFRHLLCIEGELELCGLRMEKGTSVFVPANTPAYIKGRGRLLCFCAA